LETLLHLLLLVLGWVKFSIFVHMLYLNMIAKLVFFLPLSDKITADVPKTFTEYLMIFNVEAVSHIHDRLHFQVLYPKRYTNPWSVAGSTTATLNFSAGYKHTEGTWKGTKQFSLCS
jgi:hypothetical protein